MTWCECRSMESSFQSKSLYIAKLANGPNDAQCWQWRDLMVRKCPLMFLETAISLRVMNITSISMRLNNDHKLYTITYTQYIVGRRSWSWLVVIFILLSCTAAQKIQFASRELVPESMRIFKKTYIWLDFDLHKRKQHKKKRSNRTFRTKLFNYQHEGTFLWIQQATPCRYELKCKKKKHRKARLPFCSQNEKRDLYAMVIGQKSWNKLDDVENICVEWWQKKTKKQTVWGEVDALCGAMKNGNLVVSCVILGTCFLHTTGHTPTGLWDHAALRTEHMNMNT